LNFEAIFLEVLESVLIEANFAVHMIAFIEYDSLDRSIEIKLL